MRYLKNLMIIGLLISLIGCGQKNNNSIDSANTTIDQKAIPVENIEATDDQKERRAKSEKICESHQIPIYKNPNALFVDSENEIELRTKDEIVDRAIALLYLGLKSEGLEQKYLDRLDKEYEVSSKLSPKEKKYAYSSNPSNQQKTDANWRYESLHVLLWTLGYIDDLAYPSKLCTVADDVKIIYELGEAKFREQAKVRTKKEILDQADLILRLDWACVNARVTNESVPGELNASVVYERHYTLNWLIKYLNQDWDNVTTDT